MQEESVTISSTDAVKLEARYARIEGNQRAVLCHPLPRYGGNMDNNVVLAARDALLELGFSTLRFNFRGTGASTGTSEEGPGEQQDLAAAVDYLERDSSEKGSTHVVAYSFGAWIAAQALTSGLQVKSVSLISPPVDFLEHLGTNLPPIPTLVVSGSRDQFGSVRAVDSWLLTQTAVRDLLVRATIPGGDHFYWNTEQMLKEELTNFYSKLLDD